ncbi:hypothetical protein [Leptospira yanagawae]
MKCFTLYLSMLVWLFAIPTSLLFAEETDATKLELEAESYESRGYYKKGQILREKIKKIRSRNFQRSYSEPEYIPSNQNIPATNNGSLEFSGGKWEIGLRGLQSYSMFQSGKEWSFDDGRIAFQAGTPYFPRSEIGYQNIRSLPFANEWNDKRRESNFISPRFAYLHKSKKWGIEYVYLQSNTSRNYFTFGYLDGFQYGNQADAFRNADHKFVVQVFEEYSSNKSFSWEFGFRFGSMNTNSSQHSMTLGQTSLLKDQINYIAPSTGFKFYHHLTNVWSYEFGGDLFFTPGAKLQYKRDMFTNAGGYTRFSGEKISYDEMYSIFSEKNLDTAIIGLNLITQFNWQPFTHHKFHLGLQYLQYNWRANESRAPGFRAANIESYTSAFKDYYLSSGYYESDGYNSRPNRVYAIANLFLGYTYVF